MIILGIDPGLSVTGFGIMEKQPQKTVIVECGVIPFSSKDSLEQRVGKFYQEIGNLLDRHSINLIALETPFLGKNPQNFLKLGYLRGVVYLLAHQRLLEVSEFSPREIKQTITGSGAAPKEQVALVLTRLFQGLEKPKYLDMTDALAVALCGIWKSSSYRAYR